MAKSSPQQHVHVPKKSAFHVKRNAIYERASGTTKGLDWSFRDTGDS
uniref:Uncharacterized protein n=1 Tax=Peronospora matthiolae TaxID=2874970 RepID=A0AAV1TRC5_9STRA